MKLMNIILTIVILLSFKQFQKKNNIILPKTLKLKVDFYIFFRV